MSLESARRDIVRKVKFYFRVLKSKTRTFTTNLYDETVISNTKWSGSPMPSSQIRILEALSQRQIITPPQSNDLYFNFIEIENV